MFKHGKMKSFAEIIYIPFSLRFFRQDNTISGQYLFRAVNVRKLWLCLYLPALGAFCSGVVMVQHNDDWD